MTAPLRDSVEVPLYASDRVVKLLMQRVRSAESERDSFRELAHAAIAALADSERRVAKLEEQRDYLRSQMRAAISGRTTAEEAAVLARAVVALPVLTDDPRDEFGKAAA